MRWTAWAALLLLASTQPLAAQRDTSAAHIRLTLQEAVRVGRAAPALVLPYATKDGPGPADQPFDLSKELGRVVVLMFYARDAMPESVTAWRSLRDRLPDLALEDVVVAGITGDSLGGHVRFAMEQDLPFKLLSDPRQAESRRFGIATGASARRTVVVIGRDGRVRYVDPGFAAIDSGSYVHLGAAIKAARERP